MPITFRPATHPAQSRTVLPTTASQILQKSCPDQFSQVQQIAQYSIGGRTGTKNTLFKVVPNQNGFVYTQGDKTAKSIPCTFLAGLVGTGFSSSRDLTVSESGRNDTVRPVLAWWLYSTVPEGSGESSAAILNARQNGRTCTSLAPASKEMASKIDIEGNGDGDVWRVPMKRNHGSKSLLRRALKG
ncbi:hypothetical protein R3P38DRAFT_3449828 [Favolaschia claudopus]|uniref:Uncharacterized protein n=1 Tax=Favolaschia claudopus TaxID=2862362 RepID=A0AAV9ZNA8_9AGAR